MPEPLLLIVTGLPGTGKTTLAHRLSEELHLPLLYKDGIKERLFDTLGWSDRAWSRKLGQATYTLLAYFLEIQLAAGVSCIVEANFSRKFDSPMFQRLQARYHFRSFQLLCFAEGETLVQRFHARAISSERHPGHVETLNMEEFIPILLKGKIDPIDITGPLYPLDTTSFSTIDYMKLHTAIRDELC